MPKSGDRVAIELETEHQNVSHLSDRLDSLLEQYLELLDQYQALRAELSTQFANGFFSLAEANFRPTSNIRYGQDYYDERMQAIRRVHVEKGKTPSFTLTNVPNVSQPPSKSEKESETQETPQDSKERTQKETNSKKKTTNHDPLRWFGILVPPSLRSAQTSFTSAVTTLPKLATLAASLHAMESTISTARTAFHASLPPKPPITPCALPNWTKTAILASPRHLAVFDMDSTLIQQEVIDEVARTLHLQREVSDITARAMNGELDFTESLRARCALLAGCPASVWDDLRTRGVITITPGARDLIAALKHLGFKTAVLSGGFTPLAGWLAAELGLDHFHANHLAVDEAAGTLTGEVTGDIVNAERKAFLLEDIARREGVPLANTMAVGDGANDLLMMAKAGLGVAWNAKPIVQQKAPAKLNSDTLLDLLGILGWTTQEEREELVRAARQKS